MCMAEFKEVVKAGDIPKKPADNAEIEEKIRYGINMAYFAIDMVKNACNATSEVAVAVSDLIVKVAKIVKTTGDELTDVKPFTAKELEDMSKN